MCASCVSVLQACVCTCQHACIHVYVHTCASTCSCVNMWSHVCVYTCMYVCVYVCTCVHVCMCARMSTCVCVYVRAIHKRALGHLASFSRRTRGCFDRYDADLGLGSRPSPHTPRPSGSWAPCSEACPPSQLPRACPSSGRPTEKRRPFGCRPVHFGPRSQGTGTRLRDPPPLLTPHPAQRERAQGAVGRRVRVQGPGGCAASDERAHRLGERGLQEPSPTSRALSSLGRQRVLRGAGDRDRATAHSASFPER